MTSKAPTPEARTVRSPLTKELSEALRITERDWYENLPTAVQAMLTVPQRVLLHAKIAMAIVDHAPPNPTKQELAGALIRYFHRIGDVPNIGPCCDDILALLEPKP